MNKTIYFSLLNCQLYNKFASIALQYFYLNCNVVMIWQINNSVNVIRKNDKGSTSDWRDWRSKW